MSQLVKDKTDSLRLWLEIDIPLDIEHSRKKFSKKKSKFKWIEKRIEPVWNQYIAILNERGVAELKAISAELDRQILPLIEEVKDLEPQIDKAYCDMEREEVEKTGDLQSIGLWIDARRYMSAKTTWKELAFRKSVLQNVIWRYVVWGNTNDWKGFSPNDRHPLVKKINRPSIKQLKRAEVFVIFCKQYKGLKKSELIKKINNPEIRKQLDIDEILEEDNTRVDDDWIATLKRAFKSKGFTIQHSRGNMDELALQLAKGLNYFGYP